MGKTAPLLATVAAVCVLNTACDLLNKLTGKNPNEPGQTPSASVSDFAGTWLISSTTVAAGSCGAIKYVVIPVTTTSANVTFTATCAGNTQVSGNGTGTISGSTFEWNAQGTVTQGSLTCPFTLSNAKATQDTASGGVRIVYSGTVCGIPVTGDEVLKKS